MEKDPEAAANWVSSLKGTRVYDRELTKKLGAHGQEDPEAALEWAQTLDPKLWNATSASIIESLTKEELARNAQWIKESLRTGMLTGRARAFAMRMADEDPYSAIEQALLMNDRWAEKKLPFTMPKSSTKNPERIGNGCPKAG